jgi:hypothetical protein
MVVPAAHALSGGAVRARWVPGLAWLVLVLAPRPSRQAERAWRPQVDYRALAEQMFGTDADPEGEEEEEDDKEYELKQPLKHKGRHGKK